MSKSLAKVGTHCELLTQNHDILKKCKIQITSSENLSEASLLHDYTISYILSTVQTSKYISGTDSLGRDSHINGNLVFGKG